MDTTAQFNVLRQAGFTGTLEEMSEQCREHAEKQRADRLSAWQLLTARHPLLLALWVWEDGASAKWSIPFCAELMQASVPGRCPMCDQPLGTGSDFASGIILQCHFGCHATDVAPTTQVELATLIVMLKIAESKTAARRLIKGGSVKVSGKQITDQFATININHALSNQDIPSIAPWVHLRVGKEWPWLIRFEKL
jgi:hypothetical protein